MLDTLMSTIPYIGSGLTLAAFVFGVSAWVYKSKIEEREKLIRAAKQDDRAKLVQDALEFFHIETKYLTKEQKYNLAIEQIKNKAQRFKIGLIFASFVCLLGFIITLFSIISSNKSNENNNREIDLTKFTVADTREGNPESLNRQSPPSLNLAKATQALTISEFRVGGDTIITKSTEWSNGYFNVAAQAVDQRSNFSIEYINDVKPHYYMTVNMGGDENIGTLELQGLGPDNEKIHFIINNQTAEYFLWAGEKNQRPWTTLPVEKADKVNKLGMYQDGRYVVVFLNDKRIASFDTLQAQRTGKVGIAFKRQRYNAAGFPLTASDKNAMAFFYSFSIYEFK